MRKQLRSSAAVSALMTALTLVTLAANGQGEDQFLSALDSLLAPASMTRKDIRIDQPQMAAWQGDRWRLDRFTLLHTEPLLLPEYSSLLSSTLADQQTDLSKLMTTACQWIDLPVRRGLIGDPLAAYYDAEDSSVKVTITKGKNILIGAPLAPLRKKVNLAYNVAEDRSQLLRRALRDIDSKGTRKRVVEYLLADEDLIDRPKQRAKATLLDNFRSNVSDQRAEGVWIEAIAEDVDWNWFAAGAQDIAELVDRLADSVEFLPMPATMVDVQTEAGRIVIGTAGDDTYTYFVPPLLIIDGGGNDTYRIGDVNGEAAFSMILDGGGDDHYLSPDTTKTGLGAGIMSMAIIVDKAGNDRYEAGDFSLGCGLFGVGIIHDYAGDDTYVSRRYTQGAGAFGIGLLIDNKGNDTYRCWGMAQGFGFSKGFGGLLDGLGNDQYLAEDSILFSPSSQIPSHNSSLAQGVGFGKRADYIDGHSWAGGVGLLCDLAGNDRYACGVFGQGCAYWFSLGMLLDQAGDDQYDGVWYVQGAGAHFAAALLDDRSGNDIYRAGNNMAQGAGHDFTVGMLIESGGNDRYTSPNLSLGAGNANGIGLFLELAGDDTYATAGGTVLGRANGEQQGVRGLLRTFGLFLDGGGSDSYRESYAGNGIQWRGPLSAPDASVKREIGLGLDLGE